jgi:hypothetical protein
METVGVRSGFVIAAGWVGAVAAGTVLGVATISTLAGGSGNSGALSQHEVSDRLAHTSPTPASGPPSAASEAPSSSGPRPATDTSAADGRKYFMTSGGSFWAGCANGLATIGNVVPRSGYRIDGYAAGPAASVWVKFKLDVRRGHSTEYHETVTCSGGVPKLAENVDD